MLEGKSLCSADNFLCASVLFALRSSWSFFERTISSFACIFQHFLYISRAYNSLFLTAVFEMYFNVIIW